MSLSTIHTMLVDTARQLAYEHIEAEAVSGDAYTDPVHGMIVIYRRTFRPDGVRFEINVTTTEARPTFEWLAEITIDDKTTKRYEHYLVRDTDIVETYGKTILEVGEAKASELLRSVQALAS